MNCKKLQIGLLVSIALLPFVCIFVSGKNFYKTNAIKITSNEILNYLLLGKKPYAMGWYNDFESDSIFYHYGSEGTFYCYMMIFANLNSAIIIFTNADAGNNSKNFINDARNYLKYKNIYKGE